MKKSQNALEGLRTIGLVALTCLIGTIGPTVVAAAEATTTEAATTEETATEAGPERKTPGGVVDSRTIFKAPDAGARAQRFQKVPAADAAPQDGPVRSEEDRARWKRRSTGG